MNLLMSDPHLKQTRIFNNSKNEVRNLKINFRFRTEIESKCANKSMIFFSIRVQLSVIDSRQNLLIAHLTVAMDAKGHVVFPLLNPSTLYFQLLFLIETEIHSSLFAEES